MADTEKVRVLIADDDDGIRFTIRAIMEKEGYEVHEAADGEEAVQKALQSPYDVIILDVRMPRRDGLEALREIRRRKIDSVVVMITAHGAAQVGMEAVRAGAYDYFNKPFELDEFRIVIRRALERRLLEKQIQRLQSQLLTGSSYGSLIGECQAMKSLYRLIETVAPQDVTVLIRGESGTGKELVAREIHRHSLRASHPFVSINCAAIPESLLESELFGHERGAFTGAVAAKPGRFEVANNGTIFLDEIGDMPLALQAKLLRVLQEREFERVGGTRPIHVDIRVLAATNQNLESAVAAGNFREDLFFRLNVIPIVLPPLRERVDDIPLLTRHFIERFAREFNKRLTGVEDDVLKRFVRYSWPGNIREMENALQRATILSTGATIRVQDLPDALQSAGDPPAAGGTDAAGVDDAWLADYTVPLADKIARIADQIETRAIRLTLQKTGGRREEAAELLGLSRKSLYNKMQKLGIAG